MKNIVTTVLFLMIFAGAGAQVLTLEECFSLAENNHPKSGEKVLLEKSLNARLEQLNKNFLPQISLDAQATYQSDVTMVDANVPGMNIDIPSPDKDQYKAAVNVSQIIYDGGLTRTTKEIEEITQHIDQKKIAVTLREVKEKVSMTYLSILLLQQQKNQLLNILDKLEARLRQSRAAVNHGMAIPSDTNLIKVELVKLNSQIRQADRNRKAAFLVLEELTGKALKDSRKLTLPQYEIDMLQGFEARPEIQILDLQINRIDEVKGMQDLKDRPKVSAFGTAGYGKPGLNMLSNEFDSFWIVGAKISWKLWDWDKAGDEKKVLSLQKQIMQKEKEALQQNIRIQLVNKKAEIDDYKAMMEDDREVLRLYKQIVASHDSKLDNGTITPAEYIEQLNNQKNAQLQYELHQIQYEKAKVEYNLVLGNIGKNRNSE